MSKPHQHPLYKSAVPGRTGLRHLLLLLSGAGLIASQAVVAQSVYKWVDKDGTVHFGDEPGAQVKAVLMTTLPSSSSSVGASKVAAAKSADAQKCQDLRDKLVTYKAATSVTETDALGNTREFSDDERQKLIALTNQKIQDSCGNGT